MSERRTDLIVFVVFAIVAVICVPMMPWEIVHRTADAEAAPMARDDEAITSLKDIATKLGEIKTSIDNLKRAVENAGKDGR